MNGILLDLKNLQEVDDLRRGHLKALEDGAAQVARDAARLQASEKRLAEARQALAEMRARHQALEREVADLSGRKKNNEIRHLTVKNNNEYAALTKEAEFLTGRVAEVEDEILSLLDRMEKREVEIADQDALAAEERTAWGATSADLERSGQKHREQLAELEARRQILAAALPPDQVKRYEELAKARAGQAVTAAVDGLCLACRLGFPPQLYNELQRNEKILNCPNCGRIIYWSGHPDFQVPGE